MSQGKYTTVSNGYSNPIYFSSTTQLSAGNLRYNPNNQTIEVYDGYSWQMITSSHATVGLNHEAENALDWAIQKRREEMELEALAKNNKPIADLIEQRKELDDQIRMVQILIKEENKVGTS